jgi:segregation and condensation protein A
LTNKLSDIDIKIKGEPLIELPQDLYIPPDALRIFLEAFEGPLDVLLYLIKKQNLDILDIPIFEITKQYMGYIDLMKDMHLDLAAEYLVMAAMLAEIKSKMLLPKQINEEGEEEDPRAELAKRLQIYEQYRQAAVNLDIIPRNGRDFFNTKVAIPEIKLDKPLPNVEMRDLLLAFQEVLRRSSLRSHHQIKLEPLSVRERMSRILSNLDGNKLVRFGAFFHSDEGRMGVVVTFIAILELIKDSVIDIAQTQPFAPIYVRMASKI